MTDDLSNELRQIRERAEERPNDWFAGDLIRTVEALEAVAGLHRPGGTVIRETTYDMDRVPVAGATVRISGLQTRDVETCKGCSGPYPCPTVWAIAEKLTTKEVDHG